MPNMSNAVVAVLEEPTSFALPDRAPPVPKLFAIADAADALHVHVKTLIRENQRGRLKLVTIGARKFVDAATFAEYIAPK